MGATGGLRFESPWNGQGQGHPVFVAPLQAGRLETKRPQARPELEVLISSCHAGARHVAEAQRGQRLGRSPGGSLVCISARVAGTSQRGRILRGPGVGIGVAEVASLGRNLAPRGEQLVALWVVRGPRSARPERWREGL